ncbi:MAG: asparagine synthase (glutamine-hydrolyzing) [Thermoanaerobaculaceae bacterium]|nr:asparagine synthase (glutamine-hydrolyzing) [Thermoanaerobaculaceae bacterium]TAM46343.1 MAG: asparagine synthase (glutamine-hydrolyzing) [Acidobacteriota bacterium]
MCGIAAIVGFDPRQPGVDRDELLRIRDAMHARGPDGSGCWVSPDGRVGLAHRRLAIIDLSDAAAQPMASADGRRVITFNGEIYNYRELRALLPDGGASLRTTSDTEVLLELYAALGTDMLPRLRGMFAFALYDAPARRVLLARDLYGVKPLYVAAGGGTVRVASQVRALLAGGRVARRQDPAGVVGFFLRGSVPEPFTLYAAIRALPAGSFAWADENGLSEPRAYASIAAILADAVREPAAVSEEERVEGMRRAFLDSVRYHLVADVRVGAFLSSGRDSTAIIGLARDAGAADLKTVTLAFTEYQGTSRDEAPLAEEVARYYGTDHTTRVISKDEFQREFPKVIQAMDQPTVDAVNSYFVSRAVAEVGIKVALSGTGGDELLGGYFTYWKVPLAVRLWGIPARVPGLGDAVLAAYRALAPKRSVRVSPKSGAVIKYARDYPSAYFVLRAMYMPWELPAIVGEEVAREGMRRLDPIGLFAAGLDPDPGRAFERVVALDSRFYMKDQLLRDIDWASMAHSLEVRVPLVEAHLLRAAAPLLVRARGDRKRYLPASPSRPLPAAVFTRKKTGFSVPLRQWVLGEKPGSKGSDFGMRGWARRLYDMAFRPEGGI